MYLNIHNSNLFSLLSHFDFLYLSLKGLLQTLCLLLSETFLFLFFYFIYFHFFIFQKITQYFYASSESLKDKTTVAKGGGA